MMIHRNLDDVLNQLRAAGLVLETATNGQGGVDVGGVFVESAKSVRCDLASDKKNSRHGAYRLYELRLADGIWITGAYWLDHSATSYKIELRKECDACGADIPLRASACPACQAKRFREREIPAAEIEAHKARMAEARRNAEADARRRADRAAAWADAVWLACREVEPGEHDYLARKQLAGGHGARILAGNDGILLEGADKGDYQYLGQLTGALVVPMCNVAGKRRALQFILSREKHKELIAQRGTDKLYWPVGMTNDGLMAILGEAPAVGGLGLVVEGFATGASLREASGMTVAVAFDAGGVPKVGEALWKSRKKKLHLLYCGDDDWVQRCVGCGKYTPVDDDRCEHCGEPHGKGNAGRAKAKEAAAATSGAWLLPVFATPRQRDKKSISDFNDLRVAEGLQVVGAQIAAKLIDLGWQTPGGAVAPSAGGRSSSGGRGAGGADEVVRPDAVSTLPLDALVERFIHIDDDTGEFVFDTWTRNVCKFSKVTKMLPARVRTDDIKDHPQWRRRAVYIDQIGFDPGGEDKNIVCNRWDGLPKWSTGGSCEILLQLLQHQCSTEAGLAAQQLYDWVIKWLAYPLQHLGAKMQTAILMHGPQGTGKGRFFEAYARIFGDYSVVLDQAALEDKFNSDWQERKLFILADEIVARADMYHIKNRLKNFVTGEWVRVNPKNVAAHRERNHMQIVFLSNEKQPLVLENDDRRYCVIWTPPPLGQDFYDEVSAEIDNGGIGALYHHLMGVDLAGFHPWTKPPMTEAKRELIDINRDSVDRFLGDWKSGDIDGLPFCPCSSADLYRAYLMYCRNNGERMPRPENHFSGHILKLTGWYKGHKDIVFTDDMGHRTTRRQRMVIPPKSDLDAAAMVPGSKDYRRKDSESVTEWLTPCFFEFRAAVRVEL